MTKKPTYEELEQRVKELEKESFEHKRAEETLKHQKRRLESLIEYSSLAIVTLDERHNIISCNRDFEKLFHFKESEMVGKNLDELITGQEYIEDAISYTKQTLRGQAIHGSAKRRRKDGVYIDVEFIGVPVVIDGKVIGAYGIYRDISERKQVEEAVQQSEKKYRTLVEESFDGIFVQKGPKIIFTNRRLNEMLGYEQGELLGLDHWLVYHPDYQELIQKRAQACMRGEKVISHYEVKLQCKDGSCLYGEIRAQAITFEGELGIQVWIRDITDRKQAEEELRKTRERLELAMDAGEHGFWDWNLDTDDVYFSPRYYTMLGYEPGELPMKLKTWVNLMHPDDQKTIVPEVENYVKNVQPYEVEFRLKTKDGDWRWISGRGKSYEKDKDGIPHRAVGVHVDITERKQAEKALRESEERYRNLANSLPQIVFETDERGTFTFANHNAFDLFGYTEDDFGKGLNALQMLIPGDQDRAMDNMLKVLSGERLGGIEYTAMKKDGSTFPVVIHSNPIVREDKTKGLRGIIIDLTDRKRAEEEKRKLEAQLQQAQKMEAIGTLAGGIAHDFNNILGAIIGYTEIASLQVAEDNKAKASLNEVLKAGRRARDLVKQILAFSRKGEQERMPMQISPIVKEALKLIRSSLPTTIEIRQNIESDTGIVEADPTQIHQILMNLCTNAAHAMREEGGVLEVGIRDVEVGSWDSELGYLDMTPGPYLLLTVSDTGEGMTPEMLGRIFDPYFTTKEKGVGTGLGLAVVHGIVKVYGGTIRAYSEPGKGTTFHVYLPRIKEAKEMAEVESRPGVIPTGQERILFIDDEPVLVEIGKQILERLGYEVTTRTSSIEALELFRTKPDQFDLVITDMTMPHMTGDKLAQEIMKVRPDIPIILCTGYSERITEDKAKGMGIKAFVMKPIVIRDLANTVRKVLDPALSKRKG